jgi:hypothetical protein
MIGNWRILLAAILFGAPAIAAPEPSLPAAAIPMVRCIYGVLKSSNEVQSISLYSIDGFRFALEYTFHTKGGRVVVYDLEFFGEDTYLTDKIPREISQDNADEAQALERRLNLNSKCHLRYSFDNIYPQPKARADWQRMDFPKE